jgi:hypothetical protein
MTGKEFVEKVRSELEKIITGLPKPLLEPIWYPVDLEKTMELVGKIGTTLKNLTEIMVKALKDEGFFDENPVIRVYPNYPEASGIVVFYKGKKVFERWINSFELNWGDKQQVENEVSAWYEQMRQQGISPEEYEYFMDQDPGWRFQR